jgi:hypothetical protein
MLMTSLSTLPRSAAKPSFQSARGRHHRTSSLGIGIATMAAAPASLKSEFEPQTSQLPIVARLLPRPLTALSRLRPTLPHVGAI